MVTVDPIPTGAIKDGEREQRRGTEDEKEYRQGEEIESDGWSEKGGGVGSCRWALMPARERVSSVRGGAGGVLCARGNGIGTRSVASCERVGSGRKMSWWRLLGAM
ncbi:hypothetical protein E2562_031836 [Oryza meyeriana var. granulata]|uniref:Uncharacterized protein n=1 Tax=Oryza meyeriana var. granulata TaxID=110450 RepID=A0A6G1CX66_9ORYZ|nr:hypothetical protein E2562_031836 [Oryza meyeriana var. granulata]